MVKREQIQISASETAEGGTTRNYQTKQDEDEIIELACSSDEEDEDDSWSVAKQRQKNAQRVEVSDSTRRDKRKTQFPTQLDCFELTSMRKSVMVKSNDSTSLFQRLRGPGDKKRLVLIRKHDEKGKRGDDQWRKKRRTEALAMLGLDEKLAQELIAEQEAKLSEEEEEWKAKSKAEAVALLGVDEDDCDFVYCDEDDIDEETRRNMDNFTLEGKRSSMTLMECSSDEEEIGRSRLRGLGLGSIRKKLSSPAYLRKKEERRKKKEFSKLSKGGGKGKFFKKANFLKKGDDEESSDDEPPPEVFKPYYHEDLYAREKTILVTDPKQLEDGSSDDEPHYDD